jgi:hypothetical protein
MTRTSSDTWTDSNAHDPGITVLEGITYSITDLTTKFGRRLRLRDCGWRCALLLAAGATAAVLLVQHRRSGAMAGGGGTRQPRRG